MVWFDVPRADISISANDVTAMISLVSSLDPDKYAHPRAKAAIYLSKKYMSEFDGRDRISVRLV